MTRSRRLLWWLATVVVVLLALTVFARLLEPGLTFYPLPGEDRTPAAFGLTFSTHDVTTSDGEQLRVWHVPRSDARARVIYFHGNGGNLSVWCDVLAGLVNRGFDVIAFDYRGYGVSSGRPSEQGLYRDVEAVLALAHDQLRPSEVPLVYWGRSLGTTPAAYAAALRQPDGVILESGFPSGRAAVASSPLLWALSWFASYEFPTARWAARTRAPILVIHGDADSVIPYSAGQQLFSEIPGPKQFFTIRGGDHNDLEPPDATEYWQRVMAFVTALSGPSSTPPR